MKYPTRRNALNEWQIGEISPQLSAILGGLAPLLFHFLRSSGEMKQKKTNLNLFYYFFVASLKVLKNYELWWNFLLSKRKKSQRCSFAQFELKMKSRSSISPETVKGCWLLLFGLFFFGCFCCRSSGDRFKADNFRHNWLLVGPSDFIAVWTGQSVLRGSLSVYGSKNEFQVEFWRGR